MKDKNIGGDYTRQLTSILTAGHSLDQLGMPFNWWISDGGIRDILIADRINGIAENDVAEANSLGKSIISEVAKIMPALDDNIERRAKEIGKTEWGGDSGYHQVQALQEKYGRLDNRVIQGITLMFVIDSFLSLNKSDIKSYDSVLEEGDISAGLRIIRQDIQKRDYVSAKIHLDELAKLQMPTYEGNAPTPIEAGRIKDYAIATSLQKHFGDYLIKASQVVQSVSGEVLTVAGVDSVVYKGDRAGRILDEECMFDGLYVDKVGSQELVGKQIERAFTVDNLVRVGFDDQTRLDLSRDVRYLNAVLGGVGWASSDGKLENSSLFSAMVGHPITAVKRYLDSHIAPFPDYLDLEIDGGRAGLRVLVLRSGGNSKQAEMQFGRLTKHSPTAKPLERYVA